MLTKLFSNKRPAQTAPAASAQALLIDELNDELLEGVVGGTATTVNGTSNNDTLRGGATADAMFAGDGNDFVDGGGGNDMMDGGAGSDTLDGGAGNDTLDGGAGNDTASYALCTNSVTVNLSTGTANDGMGGTDTLSNIENVLGGVGDDSITGDANNNVLRGGGGYDTLDGGAGIDTASYVTSTSNVTVNLTTGTAENDGVFTDRPLLHEGGTDILRNIENVTGGMGNDSITGDDNANVLDGGAGNDTLNGGFSSHMSDFYGSDTLDGGAGNDMLTGGAGNDMLIGGAGNDTLNTLWGNDTLNGGEGVDTASYASFMGNVTVNLAEGTASDGIGGTNTLYNIENVTGGAGADSITGDANNNVLEGGAGYDTLDGGAGIDTANYASSTSSVIVNLTTGTASDGIGMSDTDTLRIGGTDTLRNIENVTGGAGNDSITGDANNNVLDGGAGNDTLDGGAGNDTANYASSTSSVTVNLTTGTASDGMGGTDTLRNIENVIGGAGSDSIIGDANNNVLEGGTGNDTLDGGAGNDTASYASSTSRVTVNLATGTASDGMGGTDTLRNIENVIGGAGRDSITGNGNNNVLEGGAGNDTLSGGAGNDTFVINSTAEGTDTITDFAKGDILDLTKAVSSTAPISFSQSGTATQVMVGNTVVAVLNNVQSSSLQVSQGKVTRL
jgi:Ca2+-binding RTX toxin-like protein